jgi:hypothetical protein
VTGRKDTSYVETPVDYDLTCWYLNRRRVLELVGIEAAATAGMSDDMARIAERVALKNALTAWLDSAKPPTLGQLLIQSEFASMCSSLIFLTSLEEGYPLFIAP